MPADALRRDAQAIFAAAVAAVAPERVLARRLARDGDRLRLMPAGGPPVEHAGPVVVVGAGKAGRGMARAAAALLGRQCRGGLVIVPHQDMASDEGGIEIVGASHPLPDAAGVVATERLLAFVRWAGAGTLVLVLLSGGGSALLVAPAGEVTLADKRALTHRLLAAGVDITAINTVRKHCSQVKGGGLARAAATAAGLWACVLSDVVDDEVSTIASGPTVGDPTTFADARAVLEAHLAPGDVPPTVRRHIEHGCVGRVPETLKPNDPLLARMQTSIVGNNRDAVAAAVAAARARGYETTELPRPIVGAAAEAGRMLATRMLAAPRGRRRALIGGGETTVQVRPGGRGGRNQHLALAAAGVLAGHVAVLLAAGTDGIDGPTDAAGGCVDGETTARARVAGYELEEALAATDSYPVLRATDGLLRMGPTGSNVADIVVALRDA